MPNIQDHVLAVGDQPLSARPFDALDSLVLTQIVYMPFEGFLDKGETATLLEAWEFLHSAYPDNLSDPFQRKRYLLTQACAETPRYRDWLLHDYLNDIDDARMTQFCACTFELPGTGLSYIALRGTDLTLAGWREDLNMSFMTVPAQLETVEYADRVAKRTGDALMLGGHSKGGNLALYAAAHASPSTQERIRRAYSFDGPGVDEQTLHSPEYALVSERIESYIPQSSVVGMLLCYHPVYTVVRSNALGLLQHDAISWQVRDGAFERAEDLNLTGKIADEALRQWISGLTMGDRRLLSDTVFRVVGAVQADTLDALMSDLPAGLPRMIQEIRRMEPDVRTRVRRILRGLFSAGTAETARRLLPNALRIVEAVKPARDKGKEQPEPPNLRA